MPVRRRSRSGPRSITTRKATLMSSMDKAKNTAQEAKGKVKETAGKVSDNERLEAEGKTDQAGANLKQAGEKVKDAFKDEHANASAEWPEHGRPTCRRHELLHGHGQSSHHASTLMLYATLLRRFTCSQPSSAPSSSAPSSAPSDAWSCAANSTSRSWPPSSSASSPP